MDSKLIYMAFHYSDNSSDISFGSDIIYFPAIIINTLSRIGIGFL